MGVPSMSRLLFSSPSAESRLARATAWLASRTEAHVTVAGATLEVAAEVARRVVSSGGRPAVFGWQRTTLGVLAVALARPILAARGLAPASGLALEAVSARVVHEHRGSLGRLAPIESFPGLPRAIARTLGELRLAGSPAVADEDLTRLAKAFDEGLARAGLADRAAILGAATEAAKAMKEGELGALLLADVPLRTVAERELVAALASKATATLATVPRGDERTATLLAEALGGEHRTESDERGSAADAGALDRLQRGLFGATEARAAAAAGDGTVRVLSAPGESRECVEIARLVLAEAKGGTRFDRIGILLRAPAYGPHVLEALRRAGVPAHFARGARKPDPSGRALLALLACAAEGLSARRFAEYLSLGEVPETDASGAPPPPLPRGDRVAAPDEESLVAAIGATAAALEAAAESEEAEDPYDTSALAAPSPPPVVDGATYKGTLRAPRHWERLLVDASVIGGADRWERRLDGLHAKLAKDLEVYEAKAEEHLAEASRRDLAALATLRAFALPLVRTLAALPSRAATWGDWVEAISTLASSALRRPERVLSVLGELEPMAKVGPIELREVRTVLEQRLSQTVVPPQGRRYGKVFVGTIEEARGLAFEVVFVPGLAEKIFPQKVVEDPLLLDRARATTSAELPTNKERAEDERLALRLAIGAASRRLVLSYPRLDVEQARPRTPSFYGLEVLRVRDGELRGFEHLAEEALEGAHARIGWPAPKRRDDAIDEAEFDLALLEAALSKPEAETSGEAHYLLTANPHLARALRFRWARWDRAWRSADGLVQPAPEAMAALADHALSARSYSPTALQNFASCPYRFFLSAVHRLAPREDPEPIEALDPLTRGSLVHEVQYATLTRLEEAGMLPVTAPRLEEARRVLDEELARVASEEKDKLVPAIDRVWNDAIEGIAADLREWLRLQTEDTAWTPAHFELSFGLKDRRAQDAHSKDEPVELDNGLRLRGSIDLVERRDDGHLRATDYKTGKVRAKNNQTVIGGGETLQPVLYALVLEKLFAKDAAAKVEGGRLYYCTAAGSFERVFIPLDLEARDAANAVAKTVSEALTEGFLPAAPAKDGCRFCDFKTVCGPYEEIRTKKKQPKRLALLHELRKRR